MNKDYCGSLDLLFKHDKKFVEMILESCLSRLVVNKSVIIPSEDERKKINKMRDKTKKKIELLNYIIKTPFKYKIIELLEKGDGYIYTYNAGMFYDVSKKNKKYYLNDGEIQIIEKIKDGKIAILKSKKELKPKKYKKGGAKMKEKVKKKMSLKKKKINIIDFKDNKDLSSVINKLIL
jgi:hypothetical protein